MIFSDSGCVKIWYQTITNEQKAMKAKAVRSREKRNTGSKIF